MIVKASAKGNKRDVPIVARQSFTGMACASQGKCSALQASKQALQPIHLFISTAIPCLILASMLVILLPLGILSAGQSYKP